MKLNSDSIMMMVNLGQLVASLLPVVDQTIKAVQATAPTLPGDSKMAVVKAATEKAFGTITDVNHTFEAVWPILGGVTSQLVTQYKALGLHGFSSLVPAAASTAPVGGSVGGTPLVAPAGG